MTETYNSTGLVADYITFIREAVFPRIRDELHAQTSSDYLKSQSIIQEEINNSFDCHDQQEIEDIIREYGINYSLSVYINRFGAESMEHISQDGELFALSKGLICAIASFIMENSYKEYKVWCGTNSVRVMTCATCNLDYPEDAECRSCGYYA